MTTTALKQQLEQRRSGGGNGSGEKTIFDLVQAMRPQFESALPRHFDSEKFTRIAMTTLRMNPKLQACNPPSLLGALMVSAQLGLEPGTPLGHAYLVPYGRELTFIVGYRGYLDLAYRSGRIDNVFAAVWREGDIFKVTQGAHPDLIHEPALSGRGDILGVYAVAFIKGAAMPQFVWLTREQIEFYRGRSKAADRGPWQTDYEAMCLKTAVRRLAPWLPLSSEMANALAVDEAVISKPIDVAELAMSAVPELEPPSVRSQEDRESEAREAGKAAAASHGDQGEVQNPSLETEQFSELLELLEGVPERKGRWSSGVFRTKLEQGYEACRAEIVELRRAAGVEPADPAEAQAEGSDEDGEPVQGEFA